MRKAMDQEVNVHFSPFLNNNRACARRCVSVRSGVAQVPAGFQIHDTLQQPVD